MPSNPLTNPDWAPQLADLVEKYVDMVRTTATTRVVKIVRGLVFGTIIGVLAIAVAVLGVILVTKLLQRIVNIGGWVDTDSSVWVSYLVGSALFAAIGVVCMRLRRTPDTDR
jgi:hypothetical protein